eukprot:80976_1
MLTETSAYTSMPSTSNPTANPPGTPTNPTSLPTTTPTQAPTLYPTETPTNNTTVFPTKSPTRSPSSKRSSHAMHPTEGTQIRITTPSLQSAEVDDEFRSTYSEHIVIVYVNNTDTVLIVVVVIGVLVVIVTLLIIGIMGYNKKATQKDQTQIIESVQVSQFKMNDNYANQAVVVVEEGLKVTDEGVAEEHNVSTSSLYEGGDNPVDNNAQHEAAVTKTTGAISPGNIEHDEFVVKGDDEMTDTMQ